MAVAVDNCQNAPSAVGQALKSGNGFGQLLTRIRSIMHQSDHELDLEGANQICSIMSDYRSDPAEWLPYITTWPSADKPYVRNLVDSGNGNYNLLILAWRPACASQIHDHTKHCCMKILQGQLAETLFDWPDEGSLARKEAAPPRERKTSVLEDNGVAYISNSIGLHRICNPDARQVAFSLHLYTPPLETCRVFDRETGNSTSMTL